jgi:hypothetical protein
LHNWLVGPGLGEGPHVLEVPWRETLDTREFPPKVLGQAVNDLGSSAVFFLTGKDVASRLPVKEHKLPVDDQRRSKLGGPDPLLAFAEKRLVVLA